VIFYKVRSEKLYRSYVLLQSQMTKIITDFCCYAICSWRRRYWFCCWCNWFWAWFFWFFL